MTPPRSRVLDSDTLLAIRAIVAEKMHNRECFFALDVTNEVKQRGYKTTPPSNFGSHRDMAPIVESHAKTLAPTEGYQWALLDVGNGTEQSWLYFPEGTTTATIQSHVNRRVTPLLPVDVWAQQVSQQASGVQSQASLAGVTVTASPPIQVMPSGVQRAGKLGLGQHILKLIRGGN